MLVTFDKDFRELAVVHQRPHSGIVRLVGMSGKQQAKYCVHVLGKYADQLAAGANITVGRDRVRVRLA